MARQYKSKILIQLLFDFFYIGFMHLSWNINIIIMTMMSTNIAIAFVTLTKTFVTITKIWTPIYNCSPHFSIHCTIPQVSKCLVAALKHMLEKYYNYSLWIILRIPTFYQHFCFHLIPTLFNSLWSQRLMFFTSFGILMQLALVCLGRELYSSIQHSVLLSNHHQYQGSLCSLSHHTGVLKRLHFYSFGSAFTTND